MESSSLSLVMGKKIVKEYDRQVVEEKDGVAVMGHEKEFLEYVADIYIINGLGEREKIRVHNLGERNPLGKTRYEIISTGYGNFRRSDAVQTLSISEYNRQIAFSSIREIKYNYVYESQKGGAK